MSIVLFGRTKLETLQRVSAKQNTSNQCILALHLPRERSPFYYSIHSDTNTARFVNTCHSIASITPTAMGAYTVMKSGAAFETAPQAQVVLPGT